MSSYNRQNNGGYQQPNSPNYYNNNNGNYRNNGGSGSYRNNNYNQSPQNRPPMQQVRMPQPQPIQHMQNIPQNPPPQRMPRPMGIPFANQGISIPVPNSQLIVRAQKRAKTYKKVKLTSEGNLIVDCPVPDRVLQFGHYKEGEEFTHMRYTAATCDPDDFARKGYTLRQMIYRRQTEMFIVLTMYNEDDLLFAKSMTAVMKNIAYLCSRDRSKTWGSEGWKKVTVCIVADGRSKIHPRVLTTLGIMGVYQEGVAKNQVNGKDVTAHIFEYTTQMCIDSDLKIRGYEQGMVPVQILFCLKEKNAKKINSHRWFFNAFGNLLMPNVCVLIDVGTKPSGTSLYHLWKVFDRDENVAGACGEICAELGHAYSNLLNPLVASQNFEYKMSNILDKPTESVFGYISVLPGAFSAYRYRALQNVTPTDGPLYAYFKGELLHGNPDASIFDANMYLAEDRILCFELVTKRDESWLLRYVKEAKAETDVPDNIAEFISQRRRWLNGSFFAAVYASSQALKIFRSGHSLFRKLILCIEFLYNFVNVVFSWFMISNFYLSFYFIANSDTIVNMLKGLNLGFIEIDGGMLFYSLRQLYLFAIIITFISSMGNRPQGSKWIYMFCIILFAIIMIIMLSLAVYTAYSKFANLNGENLIDLMLYTQDFRDICVSLLATYGLYFLSSFIHMEPWHMFNSLIQYLVLLPAYTNILMVYAFCNTHDVSWGTKGDNSSKTDLGVVVTKAGKDGALTAEMELPTEKQDINSNYERFLQEIRNRPEEVKTKRDAKTKQEDYYRSFRTRMVLSWMFSNCFVVVFITLDAFQPYINRKNENDGVIYNPYLSFLLWSAVILAAIRFVCTSYFLCKRFICK